jgi:hypothetical protein
LALGVLRLLAFGMLRLFAFGALCLLSLGVLCAPGCSRHRAADDASSRQARSRIAASASAPGVAAAIVVEDYERGMEELKSGPLAHPSLTDDPESGGHILTVSFDATHEEAASRDTWSVPRVRDWSRARALRLRVRPERAIALSVSFIDGNGLGFTQRSAVLEASKWQVVTLAVADFWFNHYAQPDKSAAPPELHAVRAYGFAPITTDAGVLAIDDIALVP